MAADPNTGGDKIDFFVNPAQNVAASTLGGQGISVVSYTDNMDGALAYIKWFAQPDVQKKWWSMGGYSCHKAVLEDPNFVNTAPFAGDFLEAQQVPVPHGAVQRAWQQGFNAGAALRKQAHALKPKLIDAGA